MQIKRKTVSVLLLSEREIEVLMDLVARAKDGQIVHYAEAETGPNQFFGISVAEQNDSKNQPPFPPKRPDLYR
jgi:hypothetical protein